MGAIKLFFSGLGIWGYVAAAGLAAFLAVTSTHWIDALAYGHTIDGLKLDAAKKDTKAATDYAASVTASLTRLTGFISRMNTADANYQSDLQNIKAQFAAIQKGMQDAIKAKPLPIDCKLDAGRLSIVRAAVANANTKTGNPAPSR